MSSEPLTDIWEPLILGLVFKAINRSIGENMGENMNREEGRSFNKVGRKTLDWGGAGCK